jgi:GTP-binding protein Era
MVPVDELNTSFRSGFVALLGKPNAGKSTFVNQLVGQKVAIVTSRPQTTRNRILGIINRPQAQVVLIDTPGVHRASTVLGRQMMAEVNRALEGVDLVAVMIDASKGLTAEDRLTFEHAKQFRGPAFLLLNKIDRVAKPVLLPLMEICSKEFAFVEMIPVSALTGDGVQLALERFMAHLPEGEPYFPKSQITDQPERFLAGEIIREKVMTNTKQEVPDAVAVRVEAFEESGRLIRIRATISVEREGQKAILVGRGGQRLKAMGTAARRELEEILGAKVFLELWVKVERDWRRNARLVQQLDWRRELERLETGE